MTVTYYRAQPQVQHLIGTTCSKRIDKRFENEFVEIVVLYSIRQSFHCDLFTVNHNIYHFVGLECGHRM